MATLGMTAADREAIETFRRDVIEPSMDALVILDFWAEWCGPCKALGPILEKVAAAYADKGVKLVKIDVDKNKVVAAQFRVQSIPTVYALFQGQLVADLTPARTESQLKTALDQILKQIPIGAGAADQLAEDIAPLLAMGEEVLESGDAERAVSVFSQIIEMAPEEAGAASGLARALLQAGRGEEAAAFLESLSPELAKDPQVARAKAALSLQKDVKPVADLDGVEARVAADPDDLGAKFELAGGLMASGDRDRAADMLLDIIARDREWNEGAARAQLLTFFEAVGIADPWVAAQRRRLSAVLFT